MAARRLEILGTNLRAALRSLGRTPVYTATVVASLALGIGASVAAFGVIDAVRLRALPFPSAERLIVLSEVPADGSATPPDCALRCDVSYVTFSRVLRATSLRTVDAVAGYTSGGKVYMAGGEPVPVSGGVVSPNVFDLLRAAPLKGRPLTAADDQLGVPLVTVLSHGMWTTLLGSDPDIVGKVIKLSDSQYTVVGVMPPGFDFESDNDFWLPTVPTLDPSTRPSIRSLTVLARLAPGRTLADARAELARLDLPSAGGAGGRVPMRLDVAPLRERYVAATGSHDMIFAAMVGCLVLLACANLANLSLVRALDQRTEFALRAALGATGRRLAGQLALQHLALLVMATAGGLLVARWLIDVLGSAAAMGGLRPSGMEYRLDAHSYAFAALAALAIGVVISLAPIRIVLATPAGSVLREGPSAALTSNRAQQGFVIAQVAAAFVLLSAGVLLARSSAQVARVNVGFDASRVVQGSPSYPHPWRVPEKYLPVTGAILGELRALPGVSSAALRASLPLRGPAGAPDVVVDGGTAPLSSALLPSTISGISPRYFETLGIPFLRGRDFGDGDVTAGAPVAIVNDWIAKRWWPGQDPIGRTLRVDTAPGLAVTLTVVGVVADNRAAAPGLLFADTGPELYRPYLQAHSPFPSFFTSSRGDASTLLKPVRDVLVRSVPDRPSSTVLLASTIAQQLAGVRANARQAWWVALAGLALALLGIHGILAYAVRRRMREIGIRSAMGASKGHIVALVARQAGGLVLVGLLVGIPAARATSQLLQGLLHGTNPGDPATYALVAGGVLATAAVAAIIPLIRALRVHPLEALRAEHVS